MPRFRRRLATRAARSATALLYGFAAVVLALLANGVAGAAVHRSAHVVLAVVAAALGAVGCAFWWGALELRGFAPGRRAASVALLALALLPFQAWLGAGAVLISIALALGALRLGSRMRWGALVRPRKRR
jgi:hypothetical protein